LTRKFDTESKILESIADDLDQLVLDPTFIIGELFLYTDRYPCPSCEDVIKEFINVYDKIKVKIFYKIK
jgi:hypothetical protein